MWNAGSIKKNTAANLLRSFAVLVLLGLLLSQTPILIARAPRTDLTLTKTIEGGVTTTQVEDIFHLSWRWIIEDHQLR